MKRGAGTLEKISVTAGGQGWGDPKKFPDFNLAISPAMMLFRAALLVHARVGLRDVLLDYVRPLPLRAAALGILAMDLRGSRRLVLADSDRCVGWRIRCHS